MTRPVDLSGIVATGPKRCGLPGCDKAAAPGFGFCCNRHWQASIGDPVDPNADGPTSGREAVAWARAQFAAIGATR